MTKRKKELVKVKRARRENGFAKQHVAIPREEKDTAGKGKFIRERVTLTYDLPEHNIRKKEGDKYAEFAKEKMHRALAANPGAVGVSYEIRGKAAFSMSGRRPVWEKDDVGLFNYYKKPKIADAELQSRIRAVGDNEFRALAIGNKATSTPVEFKPRKLIIRLLSEPGGSIR